MGGFTVLASLGFDCRGKGGSGGRGGAGTCGTSETLILVQRMRGTNDIITQTPQWPKQGLWKLKERGGESKNEYGDIAVRDVVLYAFKICEHGPRGMAMGMSEGDAGIEQHL
jgi:hypothetical protein